MQIYTWKGFICQEKKFRAILVTLPLPIQIVSYLVPLTYCVESLRKFLLTSHHIIPYWVPVLALAAFSVGFYSTSVRVFRKRLS
jgi:ABC-type multidrug transport system permease subunit